MPGSIVTAEINGTSPSESGGPTNASQEGYPTLIAVLMHGTTGPVLGPTYEWIGDGQDYCA
jgi:hypothetical protein